MNNDKILNMLVGLKIVKSDKVPDDEIWVSDSMFEKLRDSIMKDDQ